MVELWRYDSWAPPLLGGEDLQLLKTDADAEFLYDNDASGPAAASGSPASLVGVSCPTPAAAKYAGPVLIRSCSGAVVASQPVLRGPACRIAGRASTPGGCGAVSLPTSMGTPRLRKKGAEQQPRPDAEKASDLGCELSFSWEETDLPLETAWLFDPNSDPPAEALDCEGSEEAIECDAKDPGSPVSVFYAATACSSESNSACASTCSKDVDEVTGPACSADTESKDATPECSADTTMTRMQTCVDLPLGPTQDTAAGPAAAGESVSEPSLCDKRRLSDKSAKALSDEESDETTSRPSKKLRRSAALKNSRAAAAAKDPPPAPVSAKGSASAQSKKQKGRQCCVQCFTFSTPQWREGPQGARTLCNACGVRYRKQLNQSKKAKGK